MNENDSRLCESMRICTGSRVVHIDGRTIRLSAREIALLVALARNPGETVSRAALIRELWGKDLGRDNRLLDKTLHRLRQKLEMDPNAPRYVQTVWGRGYRFHP